MSRVNFLGVLGIVWNYDFRHPYVLDCLCTISKNKRRLKGGQRDFIWDEVKQRKKGFLWSVKKKEINKQIEVSCLNLKNHKVRKKSKWGLEVTWAESQPVCEAHAEVSLDLCTLFYFFSPPDITCDLSSAQHVDVSKGSGSYIYGDRVKISCKDGYKLQGSGYLTCGKDGWNPPFSQCTGKNDRWIKTVLILKINKE